MFDSDLEIFHKETAGETQTDHNDLLTPAAEVKAANPFPEVAEADWKVYTDPFQESIKE